MQQADGVLLVIVGTEGIGADQFSQAIGLMGRRHFPAAFRRCASHFRQADLETALGQLPGRFAPGEAAADNVNVVRHRQRPTVSWQAFKS